MCAEYRALPHDCASSIFLEKINDHGVTTRDLSKGRDTGEGPWPLSYAAACTQPEQCSHSNVREGQGLTIGNTPTHTHAHSEPAR